MNCASVDSVPDSDLTPSVVFKRLNGEGVVSKVTVSALAAGILAAGRVEKRPVVKRDTDICIRSMISLTLSVDHRVVDGALAAKFIARIQHHLENPHTL